MMEFGDQTQRKVQARDLRWEEKVQTTQARDLESALLRLTHQRQLDLLRKLEVKRQQLPLPLLLHSPKPNHLLLLAAWNTPTLQWRQQSSRPHRARKSSND